MIPIRQPNFKIVSNSSGGISGVDAFGNPTFSSQTVELICSAEFDQPKETVGINAKDMILEAYIRTQSIPAWLKVGGTYNCIYSYNDRQWLGSIYVRDISQSVLGLTPIFGACIEGAVVVSKAK